MRLRLRPLLAAALLLPCAAAARDRGELTILSYHEIAEKAEDIDVDRAQANVEKAEQRLKAGGLPSELKEAQISLEKALLRKKIAERSRKN